MKVLCIEESVWENITPGKWYHVSDENYWDYRIIDDLGGYDWSAKLLFKTKDQVREEKFKELGL